MKEVLERRIKYVIAGQVYDVPESKCEGFLDDWRVAKKEMESQLTTDTGARRSMPSNFWSYQFTIFLAEYAKDNWKSYQSNEH